MKKKIIKVLFIIILLISICVTCFATETTRTGDFKTIGTVQGSYATVAEKDASNRMSVNQLANIGLSMGANFALILSIVFCIIAILKKIKIRKLTSEDEIKRTKKSFKICIVICIVLLVLFCMLSIVMMTNRLTVIKG